MKQLLQRSKDMALRGTRVFRQSEEDILYWPHSVDLWKPSYVVADDKEGGETTYTFFGSQKCKYISTPETDNPAIPGRTKVVNIFTLDHFQFPAGTQILDTWLIRSSIVMQQFGSDDAGRYWIMQDNTQGIGSMPFQMVQIQKMYGKLTTVPAYVHAYYGD